MPSRTGTGNSRAAACRGRRRGWALAAALVLPLAAGACDPCSGTSACVGGDRLAYRGEIVIEGVGSPAPGGEVLFVRRSGIALPDTVRAPIDERGIFELNVATEEAGEATGDLTIRPASPFGPYTVKEARVVTTTRHDVLSMGRFLVTPAFVDATVRLYLRGNDQVIAGESVAVGRVGGVSTTVNDVVLVTAADGSFRINTLATGPGNVEWQATVISGAVLGRGAGSVRFTTPTLGRRGDPVTEFRLGVGPYLGYNGVLTFRDGRPVAGVRVTFRRTSGIALVSDTTSWVTDSFGSFAIDTKLADPLSQGEVVGDLHFALPPPYAPFSAPNITMRTFFSDDRRLAGHFYVPGS